MVPPPAQTVGTTEQRADNAKFSFRRDPVLQRRNLRFWAAFAVSLVLHLSSITLFEVVIAFPREDVAYYEVRIVSQPETAPVVDTAALPARVGDALALSGAHLFDPAVPAIALPVVEFAELERLRIRYDASEPAPPLEDIFEAPAYTDAWARFGGELQRIGRSLRDFAQPGEDVTPTREHRVLLHRPAEGFEAYIEWSGPPHDRELLFAPPVKALWNISPADLRRPLEIVFKVNPSGRVTNVWSPVIDDDGVIDDVQLTMLQYRFAPLPGHAGVERFDGAAPAAEQPGLLFIRAAEGRP